MHEYTKTHGTVIKEKVDDMKVLCVCPDKKQFLWELQLLIPSCVEHGFQPEDIVILSYGDNEKEFYDFCEKYGVQAHHYKDTRKFFLYGSSIRPFLIHKYLSDDPARENEDYFYVDSDIILTKPVDFSEIPYDEHHWYGSYVSEYASMKNLQGSQNHDEYLADIVGIDPKHAWFTKLYTDMPGAQWIISRPKADMMWDVYTYCEKLYTYLKTFVIPGENDRTDSWLSDMFVLPTVAIKHSIEPKVSDKMYFTLSDDAVEDFDKYPIYHDSGVSLTEARKLGLFHKRIWVNESPIGKTHVLNPAFCGYKYVEKMKNIDENTEIVDIHIEPRLFGRLRKITNISSRGMLNTSNVDNADEED